MIGTVGVPDGVVMNLVPTKANVVGSILTEFVLVRA